MTYPERISNLDFICRYLLDECPQYLGAAIPDSLEEKQRLMRSLLNIRPPRSVSDEFLRAQDAELQLQLLDKGIFELPGTGLLERQGDITRLKVDAIVNAANSQMLGCFVPMHRCIDNAIHSAAGIQLRLACDDLMQGGEEPTGSARITPGFNLPARFILHTVGPIVPTGRPLRTQEVLLASCYRSCLYLAAEKGLESIAFCCISRRSDITTLSERHVARNWSCWNMASGSILPSSSAIHSSVWPPSFRRHHSSASTKITRSVRPQV